MKTELYKKGNEWRKDRYKHMSLLNQNANIQKYGVTRNGNSYFHLLEYDENNNYNLLGEQRILEEVINRFGPNSKAGDKKRVLTNTVASQPCCFNLFAPLKFKENKELANYLFSSLLNKSVTISRIDIEFTPTEKESIGDQSAFAGTDADLAVFYDYDNNKKGVILLEFKYIENEFSACSSFKKKKSIKTICNNKDYYKINIQQNLNASNPDCGYLKYENWELTKKSRIFDYQRIKNFKYCPFRFSLNQLWRNLLLSEKVAEINELDEFNFWVLAPRQNMELWHNHNENVYEQLQSTLSEFGKTIFKKLDIENDFFKFLENNSQGKWNENWLEKFRIKYLTSELEKT